MGGEGVTLGTGNLPPVTLVTTPQQQTAPKVDTPPTPQPEPQPTIDITDANRTTVLAGTATDPNSISFANTTVAPMDPAQLAASVKLLPGVDPKLVEAALRKLAGTDPSDVKDLMKALATVKPETAAMFLDGIGKGEPKGAQAFMTFLAETGLEDAKLESFIQKLGTVKNETELRGLLRQTLEDNKSWFSFIPGLGALFTLSDAEMKSLVQSAQSVTADISSQQRIRQQMAGIDSTLDQVDTQLKELKQAAPDMDLPHYQEQMKELRALAAEAKANPTKDNVRKLTEALDRMEDTLDNEWYAAEGTPNGQAAQAKIEAIEDLIYNLDDKVLHRVSEEIELRDQAQAAAAEQGRIAAPFDNAAKQVQELDATLQQLKTATPEQRPALEAKVAQLRAEVEKAGFKLELQEDGDKRPTAWGFRYQDPAKPDARLIPAAGKPPLSLIEAQNMLQTKKLKALAEKSETTWADKQTQINTEIGEIDASIDKAMKANIPANKISERDALIKDLQDQKKKLLAAQQSINDSCALIDTQRKAATEPALLLMGKARVQDPVTKEMRLQDVTPSTEQINDAIAKLKSQGITAEFVNGDGKPPCQFTCSEDAARRLGVDPQKPMTDWELISAVNQGASQAKMSVLSGTTKAGAEADRLQGAIDQHSKSLDEIQTLAAALDKDPNDAAAKARLNSLMADYGVTATPYTGTNLTLLGNKVAERMSKDMQALEVTARQNKATGTTVATTDQIRLEIDSKQHDLEALGADNRRIEHDSSDVAQMEADCHGTPTARELPRLTALEKEFGPELAQIDALPDAPESRFKRLQLAMKMRVEANTTRGAQLVRDIRDLTGSGGFTPEQTQQFIDRSTQTFQELAEHYISVGERAGFSREHLQKNLGKMEAGTFVPNQLLLPAQAEAADAAEAAAASGGGGEGGAQPSAGPGSQPATTTVAGPPSSGEVAHEALLIAFSRSLTAGFGMRQANLNEDDIRLTEKSAVHRQEQREANAYVAQQRALNRSRELRQALEEVTEQRAEQRLRASGMRLNAEAHDRAVGDQGQLERDRRQAEQVGANR